MEIIVFLRSQCPFHVTSWYHDTNQRIALTKEEAPCCGCIAVEKNLFFPSIAEFRDRGDPGYSCIANRTPGFHHLKTILSKLLFIRLLVFLGIQAVPKFLRKILRLVADAFQIVEVFRRDFLKGLPHPPHGNRGHAVAQAS